MASVSFVLLTSAVRTSAVAIRGAVARNFRPAYDILVRPRGSYTPLERRDGLVRDNYLSGIFGGISFRQWHEVLSIPGVQVAAPIANIGYVLPYALLPVSIGRFLSRSPDQLYRLRMTWTADDGLSRYPDSTQYVYFERDDPLIEPALGAPPAESVAGRGPVPVCADWAKSFPFGDMRGPFDIQANQSLTCISARSPAITPEEFAAQGGQRAGFVPGFVGAAGVTYLPVLIAAIDPVQEARLLHLPRTVVSGRYLRENEGVGVESAQGSGFTMVPVIASTRTYVDEALHVQVERLTVPPGTNLPLALGSLHAHAFASSLPGHVVLSVPISAAESREWTSDSP